MKVLLESSSLFFKEYTGIPYYIENLYTAMDESPEVEVVLGFNIKRVLRIKRLSESIAQKPKLWYYGNKVLGGTKAISIAHSLHAPLLKLRNTKNIATVHDLAVHLDMFEKLNFSNEYFKNKRMNLFKEFSRNTDALITVSERTKQDYLNYFDYPEENIHVVPLASSLQKITVSKEEQSHIMKRLNLTEKGFLLSVGGISLRKNSLNLIKGFCQSTLLGKYKLVLAGKIAADHNETVMEFISEKALQNDIVITGYLDDHIISTLYENAKAFVFPTFYEGFGIPIIEAMSYGLPVLTGTLGAASETSGGHAILADPFSPESIAEGIDSIESVTEKQINDARDYASKFTWQETARKTIEVYRNLM